MKTYPALRTAPVQLNEAAAVPVAFALYGDAMTLSPSSSSDTAVVRLMRSSSDICEKKTNLRTYCVQDRFIPKETIHIHMWPFNPVRYFQRKMFSCLYNVS